MKYLLDTNVWLWSIGLVEKINTEGRAIMNNGAQEIYFSAASALEITIKTQLGKLDLPSNPGECIPTFMQRQGLRPLSVTHKHALAVWDLPSHHRDPFDRLIIAQAIVEEMTILTSDRAFEKYNVELVWCGS